MESGIKGGYHHFKWVVQFYDDDETTEVSFPDKEVRLYANS